MLFRSCFQAENAPHFSVEKLKSFPHLINNEISDCIPNILWKCFHIFESGDLPLLGSTQFFAPYDGFPLIALLLGMLQSLFLKA